MEKSRKEGKKKGKREGRNRRKRKKVNDNSEKKREKEEIQQKYVCTHFSEALISYFLCVILSVCQLYSQK